MNDIEFKKRLKEYFCETKDEQIWDDIKKARPVKVPPQVNHEDKGFDHTGEYRPPKHGEWYQSLGPQKPKRNEDVDYDGTTMCRWILKDNEE
jgi:hypothetical protein